MGGFLVPPWFVEQEVTRGIMNTASVFWGFHLAVSAFTCAKAYRQTYHAWKRGHRTTAYIAMIWGHWATNNIYALLAWLYLWGLIPASFWLWFFNLVLWVFQSQLIVQIIINRVSLLMMVRRKVTQLKWGVFLIMALINISVFIIWIPARLQINPTWIHINNIWDRIEKGIFLAVDASLNIYFIHLVRHRLIKNGLTKYTPLFRVNVILVSLSISLDITLIGMMSMPNALVYLQFQALAYAIKLHIELNMADLIKKVVRASNHESHRLSSGIGQKSSTRGKTTTSAKVTTTTKVGTDNSNSFLASISRGANKPYRGHHTTHIELGSDDELSQQRRHPEGLSGIQKTTVITQEVHDSPLGGMDEEDERSSTASSDEREFRRHGV